MIKYLSEYSNTPQNEIQNMGKEKLIMSRRGEVPYFIQRTDLAEYENMQN